MTESRDSLGGKNNPGHRSGARSSRALSTIFYKLRTLDRKISGLDIFLMNFYSEIMHKREYLKKKKQRLLLDEKRKSIRVQRKLYDR